MIGLHLLGHGLDAIVFTCTVDPSNAARLERYTLAREWCDPAGIEHFALRRDVGQHFQGAWKRGLWPNLRTVPAARALFGGLR